MYKLRIAILVALVVALLVPFSVQAAGVYYCSALRTGAGGTGTYADPWSCSNVDEFAYVAFTLICSRGGGWLYEVHDGYYIYNRIDWNNNQCSVGWSQRYPGFPPNTGVNLPMPLLVGIAATAGFGLILGGVFLRRRQMA